MSQLLKVRDICTRLGISRTTLYKGVRDGSIPGPLHVTPTAPRWRSDEIDRLIARLSQSRPSA